MLKLTRIDDRLVHGQVAFTWTPALGINCLLVANDRTAKDDFLKLTLGLAKPAGVKLLIHSIPEAIAFLNDPVNNGLKILLIVDSVKDAHTLALQTPAIRSINFGGIRGRQGAKMVSKAIALTADDIILIKELLETGIELEVRQVPTDKKQAMEDLI
jgi:fructoselysine/glucoselysine PTS system EIIB component